MRRVAQQLFEVIAGCVVESKARGASELCIEVLQSLTFKLRLPFEDAFFLVREYAVEAAQHGERQNYVLILAALEGVANQVRDTPEEADDFTWFKGLPFAQPLSAAIYLLHRYCLEHHLFGDRFPEILKISGYMGRFQSLLTF